MGKFVTMKDIPEGEQVILDVPEGRLRVGGIVRPYGEALAIFSIAEETEKPGSRPAHKTTDRQAVKIVVQTPERAETIALAFIEMARKMREVMGEVPPTDDEDEEEDEEEVPFCDPASCEGCPCRCGEN